MQKEPPHKLKCIQCHGFFSVLIAAVIIEEMLLAAALKIVWKKGNTLELHSANPAYPPLRFSGKARDRVKIIGKYVGLIRKGG